MAYLGSAAVDIFPCVGRTNSAKRSARLVSEEMLTSLVNRLLSTDSFVIGISDDEKSIEFNLHGYYIKLSDDSNIIAKLSSLVDASSEEIYAYVTLSNTNGFAQLNGQDSASDVYTGVNIVSGDIPKGAYSLLILQKVNNEWVVPQDSCIRYTIDGGTLD